MSIKPVKLSELLKKFESYVTPADVTAARLLAKISSAITKRRIDFKMNQKEFANLLGVSQSMVSKWESSNYNFSIETLAEVCDKLNMELEITIKSDVEKYSHATNNSWNSVSIKNKKIATPHTLTLLEKAS